MIKDGSTGPFEPLIYWIRAQAFRRNRERFPAGFAFQVSIGEYASLRSRIATSNGHPSDLPGKNYASFADSRGGRRYLPWAFTEHGALVQQDPALRDIYRKLLPLLQPPPETPRRGIGFHAGTM